MSTPSNLIPVPDPESAHAFATMLMAGMPPEDALAYFMTVEMTPLEVGQMLRRWQGHFLVKRALTSMMKKPWQHLTGEERMRLSLEHHYNQLAYVLWNNHYASAQGSDKTKMDTARQALEAKLAGQAGSLDPLSRFFEDIKLGRVKLNKPVNLKAGSASVEESAH